MIKEHRPYVPVCHHACNCTWKPICIDEWIWYVSCLACNRPPRQTAVKSKKKCKSLPMSLTKNSHTMIPWYNHTTMLTQCWHKFPQSPLPMHQASAMTKERVTTKSTATNRWKQTVVHNTDKRWPCAVCFVYVCNDCKVLNVTWQHLT